MSFKTAEKICLATSLVLAGIAVPLFKRHALLEKEIAGLLETKPKDRDCERALWNLSNVVMILAGGFGLGGVILNGCDASREGTLFHADVAVGAAAILAAVLAPLRPQAALTLAAGGGVSLLLAPFV